MLVGLVAALALAAVPLGAAGGAAAQAPSGKPIAGGFYKYLKLLPKDPGWHSATMKSNIAWVRVSSDGRSLSVGWGTWGSGCVGRAYGGKVVAEPGGDVIEQLAITPTGSFHGLRSRPPRGHLKYWHSEAHGIFSADGRSVDLRVRHSVYSIKDSSNWGRCDGRWLHFHASLRKGGTSPTPTPTPSFYQPGHYVGELVYAVVYTSVIMARSKGPISFDVVRDASGHGLVTNLQFQMQIGFCPTIGGRQGEVVSEQFDGQLPISVTIFTTSVTATTVAGNPFSFAGTLKGGTASGSLGVDWGRCSSHDGTSYGPVPWTATRVSP
jgi:hypothetical protein